MTAVVVLASFWLYAVIVYEAKHRLLPRAALAMPLRRAPREASCGLVILVSPDYWWARRMKSRIALGVPLKEYVQANNRMNVLFSLILAIACLGAVELAPKTLLFHVLGAVAVIRFISRSVEIAFAFGRDVLQTRESSTGLRKNERIQLALKSYVEIYLYSAAAYTLLSTEPTAREALTLSLNVGTLTNVGYALPTKNTPLPMLMVFVQVFTTLSLVVLSLAAYLGREESRENERHEA